METLRGLYQTGKRTLKEAGIETPAFDAFCLAEKFLSVSRERLSSHGEEEVSEEKALLFHRKIRERAEGEPLQYLLGEWDFMSLSLTVRKGVLIPRPETELLVETAKEVSKKKNPRILDLCAGSGAVGLGTASLMPDAEVICIEKYEEAYSVLCENTARYPQYHVKCVQGDIMDPDCANRFSEMDLLLSNPPYIRASALSGLQTEVKKEPQTALDGGEDGLLFYRGIAKLWFPAVKPGGFAAVEIGEEQAEDVLRIFRDNGFSECSVKKDLSGNDRVVLGRKKDCF